MKAWEACVRSKWVLRTIQHGYRLQFRTAPPMFREIVYSHARGEAAQILQGEIATLLMKGAVRIVPPDQSHAGFYSRYFLVPKKGTQALRPILDLRALNKYLRKFTFRMLTYPTLLRFVRPGDWFTTVDLTDAYYHIKIYPPHSKYLRFAFQGVAYEFLKLPFGLSLSPRTFVKCTEAALAPLREKGIRIVTFVDDLAVACQSEALAKEHTTALVEHLTALGFSINYKKSVLSPTQTVSYLGLSLNSITFRAHLSRERIDKFNLCLAHFQRDKVIPFRVCLRLLGLMASALVVVRLGRLYMRDLQRWVASLKLDPVRHARRKVRVTTEACMALIPWRNPNFLTEGVPMGTVQVRKVVTTDASLLGWGGTHEGWAINGKWNPSLRSCHINDLELQAVWLTLNHFLPLLKGHHVLVRTDNTTVVAYVNRQGGLRSRPLHTLARKLILWGSNHFPSLRATHVPGVQNLAADLLSRGDPLYSEWRLSTKVCDQIWLIFGRASVDLFASHDTAQCPLYFSLRELNAPLGVDALAHEWPNHALLYAFPPIALIPPTLARVREKRLSLILIAPRWPGKHWLAEIIEMLYREPWQLPLPRDLLSQAKGEIFHPNPERLALWAWPLNGTI